MSYVAWETHPGRKAGRGGRLQVEDEQALIDLQRGRTDGAKLGPAVMPMKRSGVVEDHLSNDDRLLIVSPRVVEVLRSFDLEHTALLPVRIVGEDGAALSEAHQIVHPRRVIDCIDRDGSNLMWNKIDPELIAGVYELALVDGSLDGAPALFRPAHLTQFVFVRVQIAEAIEASGATGHSFTELDEFTY